MQKLIEIQSELKAPKGQFNSFGKYSYRSCEDILEAVKPLLKKHNCILTLSDEVVAVGNRVYIKATATLQEEKSAPVFVTAFARESEEKKGMDTSQITGSASSYARKYALNGLFCIDDTRDADATNTHDDKTEKAADVPLSYSEFEQIEETKTHEELIAVCSKIKKSNPTKDGALNKAYKAHKIKLGVK